MNALQIAHGCEALERCVWHIGFPALIEIGDDLFKFVGFRDRQRIPLRCLRWLLWAGWV